MKLEQEKDIANRSRIIHEKNRKPESGKPAGKINFGALGKALALDGAKLEKIAAGWAPKPVDLNTWRELRVISTTQGGMTVNCYLIWDEVSREAAEQYHLRIFENRNLWSGFGMSSRLTG